MTDRRFVVLVVLLLSSASLLAQKTAHSTKKRIAPQDSLTITFPDTPVGQTSTQDCYYDCFYLIGSDPNTCNASGTIDLVKTPAPPFQVQNLRKGNTTAGGCSGTPVTLPLTLQTGAYLLHDFVFSPTAPGSCRDEYVYDVTPTGAPTTDATWILVGATPSAAPQIASFAAVPSSIRAGQQTTLTWTTNNALSVSIDNGVGPQPQSGSVTVSPSVTTTYTLSASNSASSSTSTVTVTVLSAPSLAVSVLPKPILQLANTGGSTTTFMIANTGGAASTVSIS